MKKKKGDSDSEIILQIRKNLRSVANKDRAQISMRFFKTGKGEYGEGDDFLGIAVPNMRILVKKYRDISFEHVLNFLHSKFHEERLFALLVLVDQFVRGDEKTRSEIYRIYLNNTAYINNWDLVDLTADRIVGAHLENRSKNVLLKLSDSKLLWERRIAIIATFHFIKKGESEWTLKIAKKLLNDKEDLIHKSVGWMLREIGKRCSEDIECVFLNKYAIKMPRTMLRYSIERFEPKKREYYLKMK